MKVHPSMWILIASICGLMSTAHAQKSAADASTASLDDAMNTYTKELKTNGIDPAQAKSNWETLVQTNIHDPSYVEEHCPGFKYMALKGVMKMSIGLTNICYSELENGGVKDILMKDMEAKSGGQLLQAYFSKSERGNATLTYFTPQYSCYDDPSSLNGPKNVLAFNAGLSSGTKAKAGRSGSGCPATQPQKIKSTFWPYISISKKTVDPDNENGHYTPKIDAEIYKQEVAKQVKIPLRMTLGSLEEGIRKKKLQLEGELKHRPLFDIPSEDAKDDNYAFVVDKTGSYKGSFGKVIDELVASVKNYPENKSFSLGMFGTEAGNESGKLDNVFNSGKLVTANAANKKLAIDWLLNQKKIEEERQKAKTEKPSTYRPIKDEYAAAVLDEIQKNNVAKGINYKYFGDGKISIKSDNLNNKASTTERGAQFNFVKNLPAGNQFTYSPMDKNYDPSFESGLKSAGGQFIAPDENRPDANAFFADYSAKTKLLKEIQGDWEVVKTLQKEYSGDVPYQDAYNAFMKELNNYSPSTGSGNMGAYGAMAKKKEEYEANLKSFNTVVGKLQPIIGKYKKGGQYDLGNIDFTYDHNVTYSLGGQRSQVVEAKSCK